jgi:epoxyqueuosine reductase
MTIEQEISDEALRLGFAAIGYAAAGPSETFSIYKQWLESGRAAGMQYLERNCAPRSDPRELAPWAKTIVVVAARYPSNKDPGKGIAAYAQGLDYHDVIRSKLEQLLEFVKTRRPECHARICVDSAPLLEREWAVRAGIGWRGKQGQIVNAKNGCCILLGELLLDFELEPSSRVENQCGDCNKCVTVCPNGALADDGLVDARRCISYLTMEHKGAFTKEEQGFVGQSLFGCDVCTAICAWNRFGEENVMPEFLGGALPETCECLSMTAQDFDRHFKNTPVFRIGLERLKRNAAAVEENCKLRRV